jgi:hypothetical protein
VLTQVLPEAANVTPDRVPAGFTSVVSFPSGAGFGLDSLIKTAFFRFRFARAVVLDDVMRVGFDVLIVGHNNLPTWPTLKAGASPDRRKGYIPFRRAGLIQDRRYLLVRLSGYFPVREQPDHCFVLRWVWFASRYCGCLGYLGKPSR